MPNLFYKVLGALLARFRVDIEAASDDIREHIKVPESFSHCATWSKREAPIPHWEVGTACVCDFTSTIIFLSLSVFLPKTSQWCYILLQISDLFLIAWFNTEAVTLMARFRNHDFCAQSPWRAAEVVVRLGEHNHFITTLSLLMCHLNAWRMEFHLI